MDPHKSKTTFLQNQSVDQFGLNNRHFIDYWFQWQKTRKIKSNKNEITVQTGALYLINLFHESLNHKICLSVVV